MGIVRGGCPLVNYALCEVVNLESPHESKRTFNLDTSQMLSRVFWTLSNKVLLEGTKTCTELNSLFS